VRIFGEKIPVRASVHTLGGLSGHAGQSDLVRWFDSLSLARPRVILTHGEEHARQALGKLIQERYQLEPEYPGLGEAIDLD
jgi:metallo-beta-lactamase family protein